MAASVRIEALWDYQSHAQPETAARQPANPFAEWFLQPHAPPLHPTVRGESLRHQERREGSDPMTARQPGEGRQGAKVSPETGTMWRTTAQPTAAFLDLPSAPHAYGRNFRISLGKTEGRHHSLKLPTLILPLAGEE